MAIELDQQIQGLVRLQLFSGPRPELPQQADPSKYLGTFYLSPAVLAQKSPRPAQPASKLPG